MNSIYSFNSLRFILAIFICWHHTVIIIYGNDSYESKYFKAAHLAVECFFILSGFLMAKSFYAKSLISQNPTALGNFFLARFKRLYPQFIFCLFVLYFITKSFGIHTSTSSFFLSNILLCDFSRIPTMIGGMWFVTVLFWLGSFIYALMFFFKEKALYLFIPVLAILSLCYMTANIGQVAGHSQPIILNFLSQGILRGMLGLSVGIFAYMIVDFINKNDWGKLNKKRWNVILIILELFCIIELCRLILFRNGNNLTDFNIYFVFSFIIILLFYKKEKFLKILSNPYLAKTGDISYILYLSHTGLLVILSKYAVFSEMNKVLMFTVVTFLCVIFATILYFLFKKVSSTIINFITVKN